MNASAELYSLAPVLPELVLLIGAMVLLMLGVFWRSETETIVNSSAVVLLAITILLVASLPSGKLVSFGGSFVVDDFARFLKILALTGSAITLIMSLDYLAAQ